MNWGIIGLGYMSKQFARSINELNSNNLLAISSNSFFRLLKFGLRHKIKLKYQFSNYEDILSCKDVNNIYISTTNNTHHDLIIKCIEAKKNVLCEKPFVMNYEQAKNIKNKLNNPTEFDKKLISNKYKEDIFDRLGFEIISDDFYKVDEEFPKINISEINKNISNLSYQINLSSQEKTKTSPEVIFRRINGRN